MTPPLWSASAVVGRLDFRPWAGPAWRAHRRKYAAADPGGSLRVSGRYNRGLDAFPPEQAFPALYLALGPEICLGEVLRHITPDLLLFLNDYRLTELAVELTGVLDCRDPSAQIPTTRSPRIWPQRRLTGEPKPSWFRPRPAWATTSSSSRPPCAPNPGWRWSAVATLGCTCLDSTRKGPTRPCRAAPIAIDARNPRPSHVILSGHSLGSVATSPRRVLIVDARTVPKFSTGGCVR
jgi:hypothetical protein